MKTNLLFKKVCITCCSLLLLLSIKSVNAQQLANVTSVKIFDYSNTSIQAPLANSNAAYSNRDNSQATGVTNGGSGTIPGGTRATNMVLDDVNFITSGLSAPYSISSIAWSIVNFNASALTVSPSIRLYYADGAGGNPGTLIASYDFNPISIPANTGGFVTYTLPSSLNITSPNIWAGEFFTNAGGATASSNALLNNFGQILYDPPVAGTSADKIFATTANGAFTGNNPAGSVSTVSGKVASFGWEFVSAVAVPVVVEYFRGAKFSSGHNLNWKVNCINTAGATITLERSIDNRTFSSIYSEKVTVQRCQQPFNYIDRSPLAGTNYYRLKMVDADGKLSYSMITAIMNRASGFELISISPNPANEIAVLNTSSAQADNIKVNVYNISGQKVISKSENIIAGSNQIQLNVASLATGMYKVTITSSAGDVKTSTLIKK